MAFTKKSCMEMRLGKGTCAMKRSRPELLTTAGTIEEAKELFTAGADAIAVGDRTYALRTPGHFSLPMIQELIPFAHQAGKKLYVLVNGLLHHDALEKLDQYVEQLAELQVDALIFGDPAVLMAARQVAPQMKLHWSTETTSTNYRTVQYWANKGVARAVLARELTMAEIIAIKEHSGIEIQIQVHGATCIFHSKRELVGNYLRHQGKEDLFTSPERSRYLQEQTREAQIYPVWEDDHGTHVWSNEDICLIQHLQPFMESGIDAFYLEGFMKPISCQRELVRIYKSAIDASAAGEYAERMGEWMAAIQAIQPENRPLGTGFIFKEQIY